MKVGVSSDVCMVRGKILTALYKLSRPSIQRIPNELLEWIDSGSVPTEYVNAIESLVLRGFLARADNEVGPYRHSGLHFDMPAIRTLSLDARAFSSQSSVGDVLHLTNQCAQAGLRHILMIMTGTIGWRTHQFIRDVRRLFPEIHIAVASTGRRVHESLVERAGPEQRLIEGRRVSMSPRHFLVHWSYFALLSKRSESDGCLHLNPDHRVAPDIAESDLGIELGRLLSDIEDGGFRSTSLEGYWSAGKSIREKCAECEFRYACPNGKWSRSVGADLNSAPNNCSYDPNTGSWD